MPSGVVELMLGLMVKKNSAPLENLESGPLETQGHRGASVSLVFILESRGDKSALSKRLCDTKEIINASLNK